MNLTENIKLALRVIRTNVLRTALTLSIIALGIMALIAIITSTEGLEIKMLHDFSAMGSNTFTISNQGTIRERGGPRRNRKAENPPLTLLQANTFKEHFHFPATICVSNVANNSAIVKYASKKTNPNVKVVGIDENYLKVSGINISEGRNLSKAEIDNGSDAMLIGKDVVKKIFEPRDTVVGRLVSIGNKKYKVAGILASKGTSQVFTDNQVLIPLQNARFSFPGNTTSYTMNVMVDNVEDLDLGIEEATGVLRSVRRLRLTDAEDFDISKSQRLADQMLENLGNVRWATLIIGALTLLGAGVGLMNIMLVSVNERTREIGVSKALGATRRVILIQFLTEAVVICQIGGLIGILLGILAGNAVGLFLETGFIFPYLWASLGWMFTFLIGLAAGIYPAYKASALDPVEALRYE